MSRENLEFVRKPLHVREGSRRTLDQRLVLRFPRLADAYARLVVARLPPTSRVRQAAVWRSSRLAMEAFNRRDIDAAVSLAIPTSSTTRRASSSKWASWSRAIAVLSGFRKFVLAWSDVFGADLRVEPVELIDFGDRVALLAEFPARAGEAATGSRRRREVSEFKDGKAIRVHANLDHAAALEAAGLRE